MERFLAARATFFLACALALAAQLALGKRTKAAIPSENDHHLT